MYRYRTDLKRIGQVGWTTAGPVAVEAEGGFINISGTNASCLLINVPRMSKDWGQASDITQWGMGSVVVC